MKKKSVNIRTIAEIAGVSIASVSRALQDPPSPKISAKQRENILEICRSLRYYPNEHTRRMFSRRSNTVALLFPPEITSSGGRILGVDINFVSCMTNIQKILANNGYTLLLNEVNENYLKSETHLRMVRGNAVDGILIWGAVDDDRWIIELMKEDIPLLLLQTSPKNCSCPLVTSDDYSGMVQVVEKAVACGHRDFAFFLASETSTVGRKRNQAVRDTLEKHSAKYREMGIGKFGYQYGRDTAKELLADPGNITCIIAPNDTAAWGAIDFLTENGLRIPEDISVTGADGVHFPGKIRVDSFNLPSEQIGITGAEMLMKMINGEDDPVSVTLPITQVCGNTIRILDS